MQATPRSSVVALVWCSASAGLFFAPVLHAQSITDLGRLPGGTSASGLGVTDAGVVTGWSDSSSGTRAFLWTPQAGMVSLGVLPSQPHSQARAMSADGSVIVGWSGSLAFRWTAQDGMQPVGLLPDASQSFAYDISADGSLIVGQSGSFPSTMDPEWTHACVWQGADFTDLGTYEGMSRSLGFGISSNGRVVVGAVSTPDACAVNAARWTPETGLQLLGTLSGDCVSTAQATSADGSIVVGWSGNRAFRWTQSGGMSNLGFVTGDTISEAYDVSSSGNVIVGRGRGPSTERAIVWTPARGLFDLRAALAASGVNTTGWNMTHAMAVSPSGRYVVGKGSLGSQTRAFRVDLGPIGCFADFDGSGTLDVADIFAFITAWFNHQPRANFDGTGGLDVQDIIAFLNAWFAGC